jgi:DNA repair exonuclease SbcCD ATPase subunit
MIIRSIEVRNFRKFGKPVVISQIDSGLTVIVGDNEEGKSTLLDALRTVFFVRYNITGDVASSLLPYGSSVRPEIKLSFELRGNIYTLSKSFCQQPEANLCGPDAKWSGPAVDDKLQELLKFKPPGRGGGDDRHRGIWGLFWVEQGRSFKELEPNDDSRSAIRATLESEVGDVLGGKRGSKILVSIAKQFAEIFTPGGRPAHEYARSIKTVEALEAEYADVISKLAAYEEKVTGLESKLDRLAKYESGKTLEKAQEALVNAEEAQRKIGELEKELGKRVGDEKVAAAERATARIAWEKRTSDIEKLNVATRTLNSLDEKRAEIEPSILELQSKLVLDTAARVKAETTLSNAQEKLSIGEQTIRYVRAKGLVVDLAERLRKARRANDKAKDLEATAAAILLDPRSLATLKKLDREVEDARVTLESVATDLRIVTKSGRTTTVNGEKLSADATRRITDVTKLEIKDVCQITVTPGGDLNELRENHRKCVQKLEEALGRFGIKNLAEGEGLVDKKKELLAEAKNQNELVPIHAVDGLDVLEAELSVQEAILKDLSESQRKNLPTLTDAEKKLEDLQSTRGTAQRKLKESATQEEETRNALVEVQQKGSRMEGELKQCRERLAESSGELERSRRTKPDEDLKSEYAVTVRKEEAAHVVAENTEKEWEAAQPEKVQLQLEQTGKAVKEIERNIGNLKDGIRDLRTELRTLGQIGLGEEAEDVSAKLYGARAELQRAEREAQAIKLLHEVLAQAEKEAKEEFLSPVTKRVQPYLKMLLPDAELVLDENIEITGLRRGSVVEPFGSLSIGTREQLAVLARLAFADLLREKGQPAAVILDDAIVYADEGRFKNMLVILAKAAKNLQVIVLTCHESIYAGSGAQIIRLSDCR